MVVPVFVRVDILGAGGVCASLGRSAKLICARTNHSLCTLPTSASLPSMHMYSDSYVAISLATRPRPVLTARSGDSTKPCMDTRGVAARTRA